MSNSMFKKFPYKRSVRSWLTYAVCCFVAFLDFAIILTFGTMFVNLLEKYRENRSTTATIQSLLIGTTTTSSVFCGILIKKVGVDYSCAIGTVFLSSGFIFSYFARNILVLNVLIGVLSGIGISLIYVSSAVVVRNSFDGVAREVALSFHTISIGLGLIAYPYFLNFLIYTYGVNGTFLVLGGLYLNNIVVTLMFHSYEKDILANTRNKKTDETKHTIEDEHNKNTEHTKHTRISATLCGLWSNIVELMSFSYSFVLVGSTILLSSMNGYIIVFEDVLTSKGFSADDILKQFTSFNIGSTIARVFPIILGKARPGTDNTSLLILCSLFGCVGQILIYFAKHMLMAFTGNVLSGMTAGGGTSAAIVVIANLASEELFAVAFGLFLTLMGIMTLAFGPLYGYIRDSAQSYSMALFLTCGFSGFAILLFIITMLKNHVMARQTRKRTYEVNSIATVS